MGSTAVYYFVLYPLMAAAIGGAAYGSTISFSKIRNGASNVGTKGIAYYTRAGALLLTL